MSRIPDPPGHSDPGTVDTVLDADCIDSLRNLGGPDEPDLLLELIELYLDDASGRMKDLASAMREADLEAVGRVAHTLKSSSANMGALIFADLCRDIECNVREGVPVDELVRQSQESFDQVCAALRQLQTGS